MDRNLEDASLRAWPAIEHAPLEGWQLRHSHGFSKRANSVQSLSGQSTSLEEKVARCETWYTERGRPCIFRLTPFSDPTLDGYLADRGYAQMDRTAVLERATDPRETLPKGLGLRDVPLDEWLAAYARMSQLSAGAPDGLRGILERMTAERVLGVLWSDQENEAIACGIGSRDGDLVGLFDLVTAPQHRRKGFGVALVNGLMQWGAARRARRAYLQVMRSNLPAWGLYEKLGFRWVYDYWYRVRPAPTG